MMGENTIELRDRICGSRQAFDDEASDEDSIVVAVENSDLHIEFHGDDIDAVPFIIIGYDRTIDLIRFLSKALNELEQPNQSSYEGENMPFRLNKLFN